MRRSARPDRCGAAAACWIALGAAVAAWPAGAAAAEADGAVAAEANGAPAAEADGAVAAEANGAPAAEADGAPAAADRGTAAVDPYGPLNSASFSFFSVFGPGLSLEYERYAPFRLGVGSGSGLLVPLSVMTGLGWRKTGGDSYTTFTLSTSVELRLWVLGRAPWSTLGEHAMVGPFVALREDASWTSVHDDVLDRLAGTAVELSETLSLGYRLTAWRLAATPSLGFALTTQLDPRGRLAPITYPAAKLAITFGVLF